MMREFSGVKIKNLSSENIQLGKKYTERKMSEFLSQTQANAANKGLISYYKRASK